MAEEEEEDPEEEENPMMLEEDAHSMSKDIQAHLREHLYGPPTDVNNHNNNNNLNKDETNIESNCV